MTGGLLGSWASVQCVAIFCGCLSSSLNATCHLCSCVVGCHHAAGSPRWSLGSSPIESLALDRLQYDPNTCYRRCWVGDWNGSLHVVQSDLCGHLQVLLHEGPGSAPAAAAWGPQAAPGAPIKALLGQDDLMFCAGGSSGADDLRMWDARLRSVLCHANCQVYGNINCLSAIPWGEASAATSAPPAPEARCSGKGSDSGSCSYDSWCLLSGHDRGQVVVWQVRRPTPGRRVLQALLVVGEPAMNR